MLEADHLSSHDYIYSHLCKIVLSEFVGNSQQISTRVGIGEHSDAEAVCGVELFLEKVAANLLDLLQLEKTCGWQKGLHVRLLNGDFGGVAEVQERFDRRFIDVSYCNFSLTRLGHFSGAKHRHEVRAAGRQHQFVGGEDFVANSHQNVAQF